MPEESPKMQTAPQRMLSLDALRGFDMFWLVGGTGLALAIVKLCPANVQAVLLPQLDHRDWEGCTFYDTIFPLFVFMVGMSVPFSLDRLKDSASSLAVYRRIFRRFILLFVLGLLYYGGLTHPWPDVRLLGVLQRLALCYLASALLYYHLPARKLVGVCAAILIGYWIVLSFVPVPGSGTTGCAEAMNWPRYLDEHFLGGHKHDGTWDNCGLFSTLPAISSCLMGVLAVLFLRNPGIRDAKKVLYLIAGGIALSALGWAWGLHLPVIKKLWTSSYVLVTGGYSLTLLGLFYLVVDVWGFQRWAQPFIWIGANPLTIYLARNITDFNVLADRFTGGNIAAAVGPDVAYLLKMTVSLGFSMALVWFLYRRRVFIRV